MRKVKAYTDMLKDKFLLIILSLFSIMIVSLCFKNTFNFDEFYSLQWCRLNWRELMQQLIDDVHPPLHYFVLKPILDLSGDSMILARLLSAIAAIIILWSGGLFIENHFGRKAALFFCFFIFLNPFMIQKSTEIRMYMFASVFTIMSGIMSHSVLKDSDKKNWLLFVFFSLLAAYTHYYALLTMVFLYTGILIYYLFTHDIRNAGMWLFYSLVTAIGYLPWLPIAWSQLMSVNDSYWITMPGSKFGPLRELFTFYRFPYAEHIYLAILILLTAITFILFLTKRNLDHYWMLMCCSALWGIMLFSIWYGSQVKPILMSRYLIMPLCLLILGSSGIVSYLNKYLVIILCLFCALVGGAYYKFSFVGQIHPNTTKTIAFADEHLNHDDYIVYFYNDDGDYFTNSLSYYFPQSYHTAIEGKQLSAVQDLITEPYDHIFLFDRYNYLDSHPEYTTYFNVEDLGSYGFGEIAFEIYKVEF